MVKRLNWPSAEQNQQTLNITPTTDSHSDQQRCVEVLKYTEVGKLIKEETNKI